MNKTEIKRECTGIPGIDKMTSGGFPEGGIIELSGAPGVGKSIFSLHFILEGARKGQKCVYINLEEPRRNIDNMIGQFEFGDEFLELEKKGLIIIKCFDYNEYEKIYEDLLERVHSDNDIQRMVIDSFNCFFASNYDFESKTGLAIRKRIIEVFYRLRRNNLTTLLTLERGDEEKNNLNYNIPYLVDGIIRLDYLDLGSIERRVFIPKMRWTNQHKEGKFYEINEKGIEVNERDIE